jgi:nucleotide-binding universal stress UspA family protein
MKRILVGLDGTVDDTRTLAWAADHAQETHASLTVVHVVPRSSLWTIAAAQVDSTSYLADLREHFEHDVLDPYRCRGLLVNFRLEFGDPSDALAGLAQRVQAELIVIGGADHTVLHDILFGRFERRLERRTEVPLVVVPATRSKLHVLR